MFLGISLTGFDTVSASSPRRFPTQLPPAPVKACGGRPFPASSVPTSNPSPQPRRGEQLFSRPPFASFPPLARSAPPSRQLHLCCQGGGSWFVSAAPRLCSATHRFPAPDKDFWLLNPWLLGLRRSSSRLLLLAACKDGVQRR